MFKSTLPFFIIYISLDAELVQAITPILFEIIFGRDIISGQAGV